MATTHADGAAPDPNALFDRHEERLRRTVRLRLDRRLAGIVDSSSVLELVRQEALNGMAPLDREVLTLRHCEQLTIDETASVLNIPRSQASEAYIRALKRITQIMAALPGFKGKSSP